MVGRPVPDARKGRVQWLARGVSSHATRLYCTSRAPAHSVAVCGYPRSGTSWVSEVLAGYYGLPVPRHYGWPQLYPQVLHGHDLRLGRMKRVFYIVRSPYALFPSLYAKRYGISNPIPDEQKAFTKFLRIELSRPFEAPCPWTDHVATAIRRYGADAVMLYTASPNVMAKHLARRIRQVEGHCDRARLNALTAARPARAPTTITTDAARRYNWFSAESHDLIRAELRRLNILCPDADLTETFAFFEQATGKS